MSQPPPAGATPDRCGRAFLDRSTPPGSLKGASPKMQYTCNRVAERQTFKQVSSSQGHVLRSEARCRSQAQAIRSQDLSELLGKRSRRTKLNRLNSLEGLWRASTATRFATLPNEATNSLTFEVCIDTAGCCTIALAAQRQH